MNTAHYPLLAILASFILAQGAFAKEFKSNRWYGGTIVTTLSSAEIAASPAPSPDASPDKGLRKKKLNKEKAAPVSTEEHH